MQSIQRLEIFTEVAKSQSFAKAARKLGMTGPAISKQVMALEEELGVKLLHRTTRLVTLTDEGALFFERARQAVDDIREAAAALQDMKATPKGSLKVNVPLSFGHMHLLPALAGFAKKYPDVAMEVSLEDRKVDIIAEGFDMVIRIGTLADSTLTARRLGDCPIILVGAASYLAEYGHPKSPVDLKRHRMIIFTPLGSTNEWRYKNAEGKIGSVKSEGAFKANTAEMMLEAALAGIGLAVLPVFSVAAALKAGKLVHVLPDYETHPRRDITALMPPNRYRTAKVKLLADWMESACRAMPLTQF